MATATTSKTGRFEALDARVLVRMLEEGYGREAWHGPNLQAALADVEAPLALWRPGPDRHSIAEIALHHAYYVRSVRGRLTGTEPEPFPLDGEDWFPVTRQTKLAWPDIRGLVQDEHEKLVAAVNGIGTGRARAALPASECFDLALGITCHAVYHAGQIQLIKRLHAG